jgi:hypothetical protein
MVEEAALNPICEALARARDQLDGHRMPAIIEGSALHALALPSLRLHQTLHPADARGRCAPCPKCRDSAFEAMS